LESVQSALSPNREFFVRKRASPLATSSAEKVDGLAGSIGAIEGRHAKSNKPANMKQAVTSIVIEMRRIIVVFSNRPRSFFESSSLITHLYRSPKFLPILSVSFFPDVERSDVILSSF
jgi:hypothetical protein